MGVCVKKYWEFSPAEEKHLYHPTTVKLQLGSEKARCSH